LVAECDWGVVFTHCPCLRVTSTNKAAKTFAAKKLKVHLSEIHKCVNLLENNVNSIKNNTETFIMS
jgi:hypothetical protein